MFTTSRAAFSRSFAGAREKSLVRIASSVSSQDMGPPVIKLPGSTLETAKRSIMGPRAIAHLERGREPASRAERSNRATHGALGRHPQVPVGGPCEQPPCARADDVPKHERHASTGHRLVARRHGA